MCIVLPTVRLPQATPAKRNHARSNMLMLENHTHVCSISGTSIAMFIMESMISSVELTTTLMHSVLFSYSSAFYNKPVTDVFCAPEHRATTTGGKKPLLVLLWCLSCCPMLLYRSRNAQISATKRRTGLRVLACSSRAPKLGPQVTLLRSRVVLSHDKPVYT